ncbi:MAG: glycosyltransferase family 2 protein [Candidatus Dormibacteraeota bacterium]|nr:glycosyltransferase family 2 protein [Candidatus Dormibacteraeota bacterium]
MAGPVPLLSVVVPTRSEAANIEPLWARLAPALGKTDFEVCFVDDSDDDTTARIAELAARDRRVRLMPRRVEERRGGLSTAVVAGLRMARGQFACVMDADLQHPPEVIPELLARASAGADLVVASRYVRGGSAPGLGGWTRRAVSRGASRIARLLFREARLTTDPLSGFFLCRRSLVDGIEFRPVGFKILLELLVCVPDLRVVDVAVTQGARTYGSSKASMRQGLLYLGHLRSLFIDVPGSARRWKFGLVGFSGVAVFVPVLWALSSPYRVQPLLAFIPAFLLSAAWNGTLNWRWTFADQRRQGGAPRHYLDFAFLAGLIMFGVFAGLSAAGLPVAFAGLGAALVAMVVNGFVNNESVRRRPSAWARVATDHGVQASLAKLAVTVGADRAYVLPPRGDANPGVPSGVMAHVVSSRTPMLFTEAASYRAQRRSNIESHSRLLLPVVDGESVVAVVVCDRTAPHGFDDAALETATQAISDLVAPLAAAARATDWVDVRATRQPVHGAG